MKKGLILVNVLVFAVIAITVTIALTNWATTVIRSSRQLSSREQAFQAAEAGIDYYRWHLAHAQKDYTDGLPSSATGPFIHDVKDKDGNKIGSFSLTIIPPSSGSTVVTVRSKGTILEDSGVSRTLEVKFAIPSWARFSIASNDILNFGSNTELFGLIHSNNGIRFDGLAHNMVTSSVDKYVDPDNGSSQRFGVYTTVGSTDPSPPASVPNRPDVFMAGRKFPVPALDFVGMTTFLSSIKTAAQANNRYFASSGASGYHIVLKTDDTFDLYKVTSLKNTSAACEKAGEYQGSGWGGWTIKNETFLQNYAFPTDGAIFLEDDVWVDGKINTARLIIAAGKFPDSPSTRKNIIINDNLLYTNYDGRDVLGLIAQGNATAGISSADDLRIDAALIAQNGRVGRFYYTNPCGQGSIRSSITLYGMIGTNLKYGFAYDDGTGYITRNIIYDQNLFYAPPPYFPVTSDQYEVISWDEVK